MIKIGEKLNSSIKSTVKALNEKDEKAVISLIKKQDTAGADFLDINTAACSWGELDCMKWVVGLAKKHSHCGIMLDSPNPDVILGALEMAGDNAIVNSVTPIDRYGELVPVIAQRGLGVVALPIEKTLTQSLSSRIESAFNLISRLRQDGVSDENIYLDILVESLAVNDRSGRNCIETIAAVKKKFPDVKTTGGLSNISFGLPERALINRTFAAVAVIAGLDSAIMDVNDPALTDSICAAEALGGRDEFCIEYIMHCREKAGQ
ncbi:MAG: dihydropteroate synthase [Christensenellales bacterium]|jgi:cobalamin-dependent methionine synthase I